MALGFGVGDWTCGVEDRLGGRRDGTAGSGRDGRRTNVWSGHGWGDEGWEFWFWEVVFFGVGDGAFAGEHGVVEGIGVHLDLLVDFWGAVVGGEVA